MSVPVWLRHLHLRHEMHRTSVGQDRRVLPTATAGFHAKPATIPKARAATARRGVAIACCAGCSAHWPLG